MFLYLVCRLFYILSRKCYLYLMFFFYCCCFCRLQIKYPSTWPCGKKFMAVIDKSKPTLVSLHIGGSGVFPYPLQVICLLRLACLSSKSKLNQWVFIQRVLHHHKCFKRFNHNDLTAMINSNNNQLLSMIKTCNLSH